MYRKGVRGFGVCGVFSNEFVRVGVIDSNFRISLGFGMDRRRMEYRGWKCILFVRKGCRVFFFVGRERGYEEVSELTFSSYYLGLKWYFFLFEARVCVGEDTIFFKF